MSEGHDSNDGPQRKETSPTLVIDRSKLPPVSTRLLADLDPDHPETRALMVRAMNDHDEIETLIPCPGPCRDCPCCLGARMVTVARAALWRAEHAIVPEPFVDDEGADDPFHDEDDIPDDVA